MQELKTKEKYKNVYFRIDSNYIWGEGMTPKQYIVFKEETRKLFNELGYKQKDKKYISPGTCDTFEKDKQHLYLHPQSFSGALLESEITIIENYLKNNEFKSFKFDRVDVYEELFDLSDDEILELLKSKQKEIESKILYGYTTIGNKYLDCRILENISDSYKIKTIDNNIGHSYDDINVRFVTSIFKELIENKKIKVKKFKTHIGYKTI
jgi:succinate dehydrogenase flavin-adding protein (antitoxin of CptAB toxin-antitoxin module)